MSEECKKEPTEQVVAMLGSKLDKIIICVLAVVHLVVAGLIIYKILDSTTTDFVPKDSSAWAAWFSGVATFLAVLVALGIANRDFFIKNLEYNRKAAFVWTFVDIDISTATSELVEANAVLGVILNDANFREGLIQDSFKVTLQNAFQYFVYQKEQDSFVNSWRITQDLFILDDETGKLYAGVMAGYKDYFKLVCSTLYKLYQDDPILPISNLYGTLAALHSVGAGFIENGKIVKKRKPFIN